MTPRPRPPIRVAPPPHAIPAALARARLVAVLVSPTWKGHAAWSAHDEVARAVARTRDADGVRLVPLVLGDIAPLDMPYGLARLAPLPHADPAATAAALAALLAGAWPAPAPPPAAAPTPAPASRPAAGPPPARTSSAAPPSRPCSTRPGAPPRVHLQAIIGVGGEGQTARAPLTAPPRPRRPRARDPAHRAVRPDARASASSPAACP